MITFKVHTVKEASQKMKKRKAKGELLKDLVESRNLIMTLRVFMPRMLMSVP